MSASHRRSGPSASKMRSTRSAGRAASSSGMVVRRFSPLTTPFRPSWRMRRSTVHRATPTPSRCSWRHTFRAPYTPKFVSHTRRIRVRSTASRRDRADRRSGSRSRRFCSQGDRRGDRQLSADRLDPKVGSVLIHKGGHFRGRRSSSACAKYADAFRKISFARRNSRFSRRSSRSSTT